MFQSHLAEIIALATALCWTFTSLSFQTATRRIGSFSVNVIRLFIAVLIYCTISKIIRGQFIPLDASLHIWFWMSLSGIIGFVFGDYFLFKSYEYMSARIAMLMMSLCPPVAAIISWFVIGESMSVKSIFAMLVTIIGITIVITKKKRNEELRNGKNKKITLRVPFIGLFFAFLGALGQASGIVISKYGMGNYNVFAATQIRVIAGCTSFSLLMLFLGNSRKLVLAIKDKKALLYTTFGAIFGPFIGVYLSLLSVKYTSVGIASTIMAIVPVLIIPPAIIIYKEKVSIKEIAGALIAVGGVVLFFI